MNDWIVASLNNPNLDVEDLTGVGGLTTDNTLMLSKEDYLKSNFIKQNDAFKDKNGEFSEDKFDAFYNALLQRWNSFQSNEFPKGLKLDPFDTAARKSRTKDNYFSIGLNQNPDRVKMGVEGWRTISAPTKSQEEIALSQQIYDPETGEFIDDTPNDRALFSNPVKWVGDLFKDPLVLATYDKDEVDEYGRKHSKGEYKYNEFGTYYYEKLNGRSATGKTVLSAANLLTSEDSPLNKIDFFDSDDLDKSPAGVVAKSIALIAPMFTPVAPIYYSAIVAKEIVKTLPMLYDISTNLLGEGNHESPKWMETLAAKGKQLSTTTSQYAQQKPFCFENIANLMTDVALQWGLQKLIALAVSKFTDNSNLIKAEKQAKALYDLKMADPKLAELGTTIGATEDAWKGTVLGRAALQKYYEPALKTFQKKQQLGADASLLYMSLISNTDVYEDMLLKGATKKEAAWVALGSTIGMFGVDKYAHLGEVFFDELTPGSIKEGRQLMKKEYQNAVENIVGDLGEKTKKNPLSWFKWGADLGKKVSTKFVNDLKNHSLNGLGKALGEGIEEVAEEVVTDSTKAIYSILGDMGLYTPSVENPIDTEGAFDRYTMSLLGGFLGGGLFYAKEAIQGNVPKTRTDREMIDLIADGHADMLRNIVLEDKNKGKIASTKLDGTTPIYDENGNITYLTATNKANSQNDIIADKILERINQLESVIVGNNLNLTEDLLFDNLVLKEARYLDYKNASHITGYYEEFKKLRDKVITDYDNLTKASKTIDGTVGGKQSDLKSDELPIKEENIKKLQDLLNLTKQQINNFLSGDNSLYYTRKLAFALDPVLNSAFMDLNYQDWFRKQIDPSKKLTTSEFLELNKKWGEHVRNQMMLHLDESFDEYLRLEKILSPVIIQMQQNYNPANQREVQDLYKLDDIGKYLEENPLLNFDSRLEEESDEDYDNRKNQKEGESDDDFKNRILNRSQRINDYNDQIYKNYINLVNAALDKVDWKLTASENRKLQLLIQLRIKDIVSIEMSRPINVNGGDIDFSKYKDELKKLNSKLDNTDLVEKELREKKLKEVNKQSNFIIDLIKTQLPSVEYLITPDDISVQRIKSAINQSNLENKEALLNELLNLRNKFLSAPDESLELKEAEQKLWDFANAYVPEALTRSENPYNLFKRVISESLEEGKTILEVIDDLNNPDSELSKSFAKFNNSGYVEALVSILANPNSIVAKDNDIRILLDLELDEKAIGETVKKLINALNQGLLVLVNRIKSNPIYDTLNRVKSEVKSPLEELFDKVANNITDTPLEINKLLNQVYEGYVNADSIDSFKLNDTQQKLLNKILTVLSTINGYTYAASTEASASNYFGQNKQINEFARNHSSQLIKPWEELPELSLDYLVSLNLELNNLNDEVEIWKIISANNLMNKLKRLSNTEIALNKIIHQIVSDLQFKYVTASGEEKEFNLKDELSEFDENNSLSQLYKISHKIYNKFHSLLKEQGWSYDKFFEKTKFWEQVIKDKKSIKDLKTTRLNESIQEMSDYERIVHLLAIMSDDPNEFYKSIKSFANNNENIVPLTVQLDGIRIAEAAHSKEYKAGFKALAKYIDPDRTITPNIVHLNGVGGAGKTDVLLKQIHDRFVDDLNKALIIAPTKATADKLLNALGESESYNIDPATNVFSLIVENWNEISSEFESASKELSRDLTDGKSIDNKFFTISYHNNSEQGTGVSIKLKPLKFKFSENFKDRNLIFVDEAAHLSAFEIATLNSFCDFVEKKSGRSATAFLASDNIQSGYFKDRIENLEPSSIFCTRVFKLTESLRSSNIQKQENNSNFENLIDSVDEIINIGTFEQGREALQKLPLLAKNLKFRAYVGEDDINGDLINANLDDVLKKIPKPSDDKKGYICFIGSSESENFKKVKALFPNVEVLSAERTPGKSFVQGQEYDYVIVDNLENPALEIKGDYAGLLSLKKYYTLMSRAKVASIFLDDLTKVFGENQIEDLKSKGFNILDLVSDYRNLFLQQIDKIEFLDHYFLNTQQAVSEQTTNEEQTSNEEEETAEASNEEESETNEEETPSEPEEDDDFEIPLVDENSNDPLANMEGTEELFDARINSEKKEVVRNLNEFNPTPPTYNVTEEGELCVEANTTRPIIGLESREYVDDKGVTRKEWIIPKTKNKIKRNGEALVLTISDKMIETYGDDRVLKSYNSKIELQRKIEAIQRAVVFNNGSLSNTDIYWGDANFGKKFKQGKLQLEVRKATSSDYFGINVDLDPTFIDINGTKYVISLVYQVDNLEIAGETFTALFDISLLTDFNEVSKTEKRQAILDNLDKIIRKKSPDSEERKRLQTFRDNFDESIKLYKSFVETLLNGLEDGFRIDLDEDDYKSHKTTRLVKRKKARRLGGRVSVETVDSYDVDESGNYKEDNNTFLDKNSSEVISDVYIINDKNKSEGRLFPNEILGKAVIFVSSNKSIPKNELIDRYIELKKDPENNNPEVRCIVLDNKGLSFSDLVYQRLEHFNSGAKGKIKKPWRMDVLGVRMFNAMWNFRAGLIKFNNELSEFKKLNGWDDERLDKLLKLESKLYVEHHKDEIEQKYPGKVNFENKSDDELKSIYYGDYNADEDLLKLNEFNLETLKNIPIFRLGFDLTGSQIGGYVRNFKVSSDGYYKNKDSVNLLTLNPETANKYLKLLDKVFSLIGLKNSDEAESIARSMELTLVRSDGTEYPKDEFINKENRNLTGLIKLKTNNKIKYLILLEPDPLGGEPIEVICNSLFSYLPKAISLVTYKAKEYSKKEEGSSGLINIRTQGDNKEGIYQADISELFADDMLTHTSSGDNTLFTMFNFIFHGTNENIHKSHAYTEDAPFKYGIYIDPYLEHSSNYDVLNYGGTEKKDYILLKCGTNPAFFDVDVDVVPGGILVNIGNIKKKYFNPEESNKPKEEQIHSNDTFLDNLIDLTEDEFKKLFNVEISSNEIKDVISGFIDEVDTGKRENSQTSFEELLTQFVKDLPMKYTLDFINHGIINDNKKEIIIRTIKSNLIGGNNINITNISYDEGIIEFRGEENGKPIKGKIEKSDILGNGIIKFKIFDKEEDNSIIPKEFKNEDKEFEIFKKAYFDIIEDEDVIEFAKNYGIDLEDSGFIEIKNKERFIEIAREVKGFVDVFMDLSEELKDKYKDLLKLIEEELFKC